MWTRILVEFGPPLVVLEEEFFILRTYISLASSVSALHRSTTGTKLSFEMISASFPSLPLTKRSRTKHLSLSRYYIRS